MTTDKPREVKRHEVRAICAAGGEVTDGDGDVWCMWDGELGYVSHASGLFGLVPILQGEIVPGPFTVTKEPPPKAQPWRRGVPEKSGVYWVRSVSRTGARAEPDLCDYDRGVCEFFGTGCSASSAEWFESTEFAPLQERAPE